VANTAPPTDVVAFVNEARKVPGVRGAELFSLVDLPPGSLRSGIASLGGPVKVIAMDQPSYESVFPVVRVLAGAPQPGTVTLSRRAAEALSATPGHIVFLSLPGRPTPVAVPVGAIVDLTRADELFANRNPDDLGDPLPFPYVVAFDTATFRSTVLPALRADATSKTPVASPPVVEVHVAVDRAALGSDPAKALRRENALRRTLERIAPGEVVAIDNAAATLRRATRDTILAKALFLLLGLPGVLLAASVARYSAGLFAEGRRRERALLRARGFGPGTLRRAIARETILIGVLGAVVGVAAGVVTARLLLPIEDPAARSIVLSVALATITAAATAITALYLPGRRALAEQVDVERRELVDERPARWLTSRLDLVLLGASLVIAAVTYFAGGFRLTADSAEGQSVALSFFFLLCPLFAWLGIILVLGRGMLAVGRRRAGRARPAIAIEGRLRRRLLTLSLVRRARPAVTGIIVVALATSFCVGLSVFIDTYNREQEADARFITGGDVRVILGTDIAAPADFEARLRVPGVTAVSPLASTSSAQVGNEPSLQFAGIDPTRFAELSVLEAGFSEDLGPDEALEALAADPTAVLVDHETADQFNLSEGDSLRVELPNVSQGRPVSTTVKVVGIHQYFPGFPVGVDFIGNLANYQAVTAAPIDTYALAVAPMADPQAVAAAIDAGVGQQFPMRLDTTANAVNREQSTLAALNLDTLGHLDLGFGLLLGATGAAVFVFGVLLLRRREHVTLRAMGLGLPSVAAVVLGEAAVVAAVALVVGTGVGVAMAAINVQILRPLFMVPPRALETTLGAISVPAALVAAGTVLALVAGLAGLARARLTEILRED
ncbi:MAG: ABC transporter permease, partial [Acidimicrobiales bacterium]